MTGCAQLVVTSLTVFCVKKFPDIFTLTFSKICFQGSKTVFVGQRAKKTAVQQRHVSMISNGIPLFTVSCSHGKKKPSKGWLAALLFLLWPFICLTFLGCHWGTVISGTVTKCYLQFSRISNPLYPFLDNFSTAYSQHAVHCTQLPLPLRFTICPVYLVTSTMRSYLQDTLSCCSQAPWAKWTSVSKWDITLTHSSFFFQSALSLSLIRRGTTAAFWSQHCKKRLWLVEKNTNKS